MLSDRIRKLRKRFKLTKAEFASKICMSVNAVYEWEHDKVEIKPSSLLLIELVFNVNPDWLLEGEGEMLKPMLSPNAENLVAWLKSLPIDDQIWAVKEFERHVPEFKMWISK